jgi:hypothetical protein
MGLIYGTPTVAGNNSFAVIMTTSVGCRTNTIRIVLPQPSFFEVLISKYRPLSLNWGIRAVGS